MDESAKPLTRAELIDVSRSEGGGAGPMYRRIESREPEVVPCWGSLVDFGGKFFFLQGLHEGLPPTPGGNFGSEGQALDWLVDAINRALPAVCAEFRRRASERAAMRSDALKEIAAKAQRDADMAAKRARDSEVS